MNVIRANFLISNYLQVYLILNINDLNLAEILLAETTKHAHK